MHDFYRASPDKITYNSKMTLPSPPSPLSPPLIQEKLGKLQELITLHNKQYNLIGPSTLPHIQTRHFQDSLQIQKFIPDKNNSVIDIGSGAGFPGLILSIAGYTDITLLDKNRHKCDFLKIAAKATGTNPIVINRNLKDFHRQSRTFQTITARAVAPTHILLPLCMPLLQTDSQIILMKGENYAKEWQQTPENIKRQFDLTITPSETNRQSAILQLTRKS